MKDQDFKYLAFLIINAKAREDYDTVRSLYRIAEQWYGHNAPTELENKISNLRNYVTIK